MVLCEVADWVFGLGVGDLGEEVPGEGVELAAGGVEGAFGTDEAAGDEGAVFVVGRMTVSGSRGIM